MKKLKKYQENAVNKLVQYSIMEIDSKDNKPILLCAPTGSGKTFMITNYIKQMISNYKENDLCFVWMSIGKNQLHVQSYKKLKEDSNDEFTCKAIDELNFKSDECIEKNEIIFLDWDSLNRKDTKTGKSKNSLLEESEDRNFKDYIDATHKYRKIIMIIDESHIASETGRSIEIKNDIISADLIIEMSATPHEKSYKAQVTVSPTDVIKEAMIKNEILINPDLDKLPSKDTTSTDIVLNAAYKKRIELLKLYNKEKSKVNPLVLIQIPNSELGDKKKDYCVKFFENKGITLKNGKLAICYGEDEIDKASDKILALNGTVEFLIFKVKLDTGWDCPRAQILVKFRETNSITFEVQTLGRIIRMPEPQKNKYYSSQELNMAYVYTNIQSIMVKKETYNPNIIKTLHSIRNKKYKSIKLKSYYKNRVDYGDITSDDKPYEQLKENFFDLLNVSDSKNLAEIKSAIKRRIEFNTDDLDKIILNEKLETEKIDIKQTVETDDEVLSTNYAPEDLQYVFEKIIVSNLNGFAPVRSKSKIKVAVLNLFKDYFDIDIKDGGIERIQRIVVRNNDFFSDLISNTCKDLLVIHSINTRKKEKGKWSDFEIDYERYYNENSFIEVQGKLSLHQPLYLEKQNNDKCDQLEVDFIKYLDKKSKWVEWYWKNGKEHNAVNLGIFIDENSDAFRPDFIIQFKNGKLGIFDTKPIGYNENDTKIKANALNDYIQDLNKKNVFGGIVVQDKNKKFKYITKVYVSYKDNQKKWSDFENLFN